MSKTPSDRLFRLVKSLTVTERRYFKVWTGAELSVADNKYLLLFDSIVEQETFDDQQLAYIVYGTKKVKGKKYSELKAYLYAEILTALQFYDEGTSVEFRLKKMLLHIKVLYRRNLWDDCITLIKKTRKVAESHEHFVTMLELCQWERKIAYTATDITWLDANLERLTSEEADLQNKITNEAAYRNLFFELLVRIRKDASLRKEEQMARLKEIWQQTMVQDVNEALSFQSTVLFYRIRTVYAYATRQFEQFYEEGKILLIKMQSHPLLKEDLSEYISVISNLVFACRLTNRFDEAWQYLDLLKKLQPITMDDRIKIHRQFYQGTFSLSAATGTFEKGWEAMEQHLAEIPQLGVELFQNATFYFHYFTISFGVGNYDAALQWLVEWMNQSKSEDRKDLQHMGKILELLIHFEQDHQMLMESLIRTNYRYFKKEDTLNAFEKRMVDFMKEMIRTVNKKEQMQAFVQLKADFEAFAERPAEKAMLESYFNFPAWIDAKIEKRSFAQVVREQFLLKKS